MIRSAAFIFIFMTVHAQTLHVPSRPVTAETGRQLYADLVPLPRSEREDLLFKIIEEGNIPDFLRPLQPITVKKQINGTEYTLEYFVTPDYLSVGHDTDHVLMPMTPILAQRIADRTNCMLPTAMMVDQIYAASALKLPPQPIPPDAEMVSMQRFYQHNDSVQSLRRPAMILFPLGILVGGTKKDIVIDVRIYSQLKKNCPKPVVIYGWHRLNGIPIQPAYNGHGETYADYSHGVRLVQRMAKINGADISLTDIVQDPVYHQLISDTVLVKPYYNYQHITKD